MLSYGWLASMSSSNCVFLSFGLRLTRARVHTLLCQERQASPQVTDYQNYKSPLSSVLHYNGAVCALQLVESVEKPNPDIKQLKPIPRSLKA